MLMRIYYIGADTFWCIGTFIGECWRQTKFICKGIDLSNLWDAIKLLFMVPLIAYRVVQQQLRNRISMRNAVNGGLYVQAA